MDLPQCGQYEIRDLSIMVYVHLASIVDYTFCFDDLPLGQGGADGFDRSINCSVPTDISTKATAIQQLTTMPQHRKPSASRINAAGTDHTGFDYPFILAGTALSARGPSSGRPSMSLLRPLDPSQERLI